jgi:hypothetical protein
MRASLCASRDSGLCVSFIRVALSELVRSHRTNTKRTHKIGPLELIALNPRLVELVGRTGRTGSCSIGRECEEGCYRADGENAETEGGTMSTPPALDDWRAVAAAHVDALPRTVIKFPFAFRS